MVFSAQCTFPHCEIPLDEPNPLDEIVVLLDPFDPMKFHCYWNLFDDHCSGEMEEFIP